jgi:protein TonB
MTNRNTSIATGVVLLHLGALWALQTGLLRRVADLVVPAEMLVEIMAAPAPANVAPPRQPSPPKPTTPAPPVPAKAAVTAPVPLAVADTNPVPSSAAAPTPAPAAAAPTTNAAGPATAAATTPPVAKVDLPSSDADYLHNPKPPYPGLSKRLGEQGKVLVRTLIGADGLPQKAEIKQSSGFDRLDQAALTTALRWRYVPGKRAGVAEAMWFNVPFTFVLE